MEITLADLLILEPRLNPGEAPFSGAGASSRLEQTPVSWAVTARTTLPHLPLLRGGELLLLPPRATQAIGEELAALMRESAARDVCGIVFAFDDEAFGRTYPLSHDMRIHLFRWSQGLSADTETDINRLLTECRGNLYRIGTELERHLADVTASRSGLESLIRVVSESTGLCMAVVDANGRHLAAAHDDCQARDADIAVGTGATDTGDNRWESRRVLNRGATLVLKTERPEQRIVARFLIDRIATAANAALQRDDAARPRGLQRADATAHLLSGSGSASDQRARALALGLDPDGVFLVAVSDADSAAVMARLLAPLGTAHPARGRIGRRVMLVAATRRIPPENLFGSVREVTNRWERDAELAGYSLALSGPAFGVASLPRAAMEADFVAAMQSVGDVTRRAASFGSVDDLGAMGLLYQLRDSAELRGFIAEALGTLPVRDRRGTLRSTLRAFLESGGSQVDASQRLGIHRNTLAYRLRRIGELVGRDVADPTAWLTLHLALRASDMLEACAEHG